MRGGLRIPPRHRDQRAGGVQPEGRRLLAGHSPLLPL